MGRNGFFRSLLLLVIVAALSSCTSYQYTARQVKVNRRTISSKEQMAGIKIDFNRTVTATSDYNESRGEAIKEAEYKCLQDNKIAVIVDPIYKVEYRWFHLKGYKATVVGFAGMYEEKPAGVDAVKEYDKEDIEKFRLLTDPDFPQYYYDNGNGSGNATNYYFNASSSAPIGVQPIAQSERLALTANVDKNAVTKQPKVYDYFKAQQLRNAGIITSSVGAAAVLLLGLPCMYANDEYDAWHNDHSTSWEAYCAGISFMAMGSAAIVAGVPMIVVGSYRLKHSDGSLDVALSPVKGASGLGLSLTF